MIVQGSGPIFNSAGGSQSPGRLVPAHTASGEINPCCCDGIDPPPPGRNHYFVCRSCDGTEKLGPNVEAIWYYSHGDSKCYWCRIAFGDYYFTDEELEASGWDYFRDDEVFTSISPTIYLNYCDFVCFCTGDCDPPPPDPVVDPPPKTCACGANLSDSEKCGCIADIVRATISGVSACVCVPCGSWSIISFRLDDALNGVWDLAWNSDPVDPRWTLDVTFDFSYSEPGDVGTCIKASSVLFTFTLTKLNPTTFAFAVMWGAYEADPRSFDTTDDNFRLFSGSGTVPDQTCLSIPTMINAVDCLCDESAPAPFGFFYAHVHATTGGSVSFDACL